MLVRINRDITKERGFPVFYVYFKNALPPSWRQGETWTIQNTGGYWAENREGIRVKVGVSTSLEDSKTNREIENLLESSLKSTERKCI